MHRSLLLWQAGSWEVYNDTKMICVMWYHHKQVAAIYFISIGDTNPNNCWKTALWICRGLPLFLIGTPMAEIWCLPLLLLPQGKYHHNLAVGVYLMGKLFLRGKMRQVKCFCLGCYIYALGRCFLAWVESQKGCFIPCKNNITKWKGRSWRKSYLQSMFACLSHSEHSTMERSTSKSILTSRTSLSMPSLPPWDIIYMNCYFPSLRKHTSA